MPPYTANYVFMYIYTHTHTLENMWQKQIIVETRIQNLS